METDIKKIIDAIDALKDKYDFKDMDNEEEAWDELESAVIALETYKEIHERDMEYSKIKDFLD
jgi:hypothetical protein